MAPTSKSIMLSGVYRILVKRAKTAVSVYVGQSVNVHERWKQHLRGLKAGKHANIRLQRLYNKGAKLVFALVAVCAVESLFAKEREVYLWHQQRGYQLLNLAEVGVPCGGGAVQRKAVEITTPDGLKLTYRSVREAARAHGLAQSNLSFILNGDVNGRMIHPRTHSKNHTIRYI